MFFPSICFIAFLLTANAQLDGIVSDVGSGVRSAVSPVLGALQGVSNNVKQQLFEILNDNNIPMADQLSKTLEVVTDESDDVQAAVQALFDAKQDTFVPALQKVATNLGPKETKIINQLKTIVQDQTLSAADQCNQVQQVVSNSTFTKQLKPIESMACNALKRQIPTQNGPVKLSNILGIDVAGVVGGLPLVGGTAKNLLGGLPLKAFSNQNVLPIYLLHCFPVDCKCSTRWSLFDGKQDTFVPALQKVATNLGPKETKIINQLKTIVQDQTLSAADQCNQVQQVVSNSTFTKQLKPIESIACNALKGQIPTQNGPVKLSNILGIDVAGVVGGLPLVGGTAKNLLEGLPLVKQLF